MSLHAVEYLTGQIREIASRLRPAGGYALEVASNAGLDIFTYDNQSIPVGVVAGINLISAAIPAGVTEVLVEYENPNTGGGEVAYIRWNAAASSASSVRIRDGDTYILAVPPGAGPNSLNVIGDAGVTGGTAVWITPLGP